MEGGTLPRHWLLRALELEPTPEQDQAEASRAAVLAFRDAVGEAWTGDTEAAEAISQLEAYAQRLRRARPGDALLGAALDQALASLPQGRDAVLAALDESVTRGASSGEALLMQAESLFRPGTRALTLGYHGTIVRLLIRCGPLLEAVTVSEGRPDGSGARLAGEIGAQTIPVRLITESELELIVPECDMAVAAAERVLPDGDVVATVGTAVLARICAGHQVPFYVLAESERWVGEGTELAHFTWERRSPAAVLAQPPRGVQVLNVAFDLTPAALVTGYVTESGVSASPADSAVRHAA